MLHQNELSSGERGRKQLYVGTRCDNSSTHQQKKEVQKQKRKQNCMWKRNVHKNFNYLWISFRIQDCPGSLTSNFGHTRFGQSAKITQLKKLHTKTTTKKTKKKQIEKHNTKNRLVETENLITWNRHVDLSLLCHTQKNNRIPRLNWILCLNTLAPSCALNSFALVVCLSELTRARGCWQRDRAVSFALRSLFRPLSVVWFAVCVAFFYYQR